MKNVLAWSLAILALAGWAECQAQGPRLSWASDLAVLGPALRANLSWGFCFLQGSGEHGWYGPSWTPDRHFLLAASLDNHVDLAWEAWRLRVSQPWVVERARQEFRMGPILHRAYSDEYFRVFHLQGVDVSLGREWRIHGKSLGLRLNREITREDFIDVFVARHWLDWRHLPDAIAIPMGRSAGIVPPIRGRLDESLTTLRLYWEGRAPRGLAGAWRLEMIFYSLDSLALTLRYTHTLFAS